jgi:hypothetical protein
MMTKLSCGMGPPPGAPRPLAELLAWWEAKAHCGLPERSRLEPAEIARHLAQVALLDVEGRDFRFRLAGEGMQARYGALRGRRLSELLAGRALAEALAEHHACVETRRPTLARRAEPAPDSSDTRRYWRLLLPFGRAGDVAVLLAAMRFDLK